LELLERYGIIRKRCHAELIEQATKELVSQGLIVFKGFTIDDLTWVQLEDIINSQDPTTTVNSGTERLNRPWKMPIIKVNLLETTT